MKTLCEDCIFFKNYLFFIKGRCLHDKKFINPEKIKVCVSQELKPIRKAEALLELSMKYGVEARDLFLKSKEETDDKIKLSMMIEAEKKFKLYEYYDKEFLKFNFMTKRFE